MSEKIYCEMCNIELDEAELIDNCCPYCQTAGCLYKMQSAEVGTTN